MEGVSSEAASLAGRLHLGLGKLTVFFDSNHITLEGAADVEFAENVGERFDAYGWHVAEVENVNALSEIDQAIAAADRRDQPAQPRPGAQPHRLRLAGPGHRQGARRAARRGERRQDPRDAGLAVSAVRDPGCGLRPLAQPGRRAGGGARRLARALRALPGRPSGPGGRVRARDRGAIARRMARCAAQLRARLAGRDARLGRQGARRVRREDAGAGRRLRRRGPLDPHGDQRLGRCELRRLDRPQHPFRHPRARHGGDLQRHGRSWRLAAVLLDLLLLPRLHGWSRSGSPR